MSKEMLKKWKRTCLSYLIAYGGKNIVRLLLKTCKVNIKGLAQFTDTVHNSPCILMLWHSKLVIISEILDKWTQDTIFTAFISKSRDGDPLAYLAESYSRGKALRVPHNSRHIALNKMIDTLKENREVIIITPDGPRGPKNIVKPGVVVAAKESAAAIIPFSWSAKECWQLKTWDQMIIPKPFTTIDVVFGAEVKLSGSDDLENDAHILTNALQSLEK